MEKAHDIPSTIKGICEKAFKAAEQAGTKNLKIMAVTKNVPVETVEYARKEGIELYGENRVQEFLLKKTYFEQFNMNVHLIGHLQSNKVKQAVGSFDVIQSVDSIRIASLIGQQAVERSIVQKILLEVNIGKEPNKYGFMYEETEEAVDIIKDIQGVQIVGLMTIPPIGDEHVSRGCFSLMHRLFIDITNKKKDNVRMEILSMGMSADYIEAIGEGSNLIRIGTAFFR